MAALKKRRDTLPQVADRFYRHLAGQVDVQGTDASERALVRRHEDGAVEVEVAPRAEDGTAGTPYFSRRFVPGETEEVRLYLRGGNDRVVVEGRGGGVKVRAVGGVGDDVLDDSKGGGTRLYDFEGQNKVVEGPGTKRDDKVYEAPPGPKNAPWIPPRDWGRDWFALPWASYSSDYGVFLGGGFATEELRLPPAALREPARAARGLGLRREPAARSPTTASSTSRTPAPWSGSWPATRASRCCATTASATTRRPRRTTTSTRSGSGSSCSRPA